MWRTLWCQSASETQVRAAPTPNELVTWWNSYDLAGHRLLSDGSVTIRVGYAALGAVHFAPERLPCRLRAHQTTRSPHAALHNPPRAYCTTLAFAVVLAFAVLYPEPSGLAKSLGHEQRIYLFSRIETQFSCAPSNQN